MIKTVLMIFLKSQISALFPKLIVFAFGEVRGLQSRFYGSEYLFSNDKKKKKSFLINTF